MPAWSPAASPLDDEALAGGRAWRGRSSPNAAVVAEDDIGLAGIDAAVVAVRRADDEVVEAVAVDVAAPRRRFVQP